jgi:hypothetical protein
MRLNEIQVGSRYETSVCGRLIDRARIRHQGDTIPALVVLGFDETTGRRITIRSLQNLRRPIEG